MSNIYEKLSNIQQAIKVPKDRYNAFAGFKHRSAEDILEKVKPLLNEQGLIIVLNDDVQEVAGQAYIKATAKLIDIKGDDQDLQVSAYAREEKARPKMSEGQLTGAASSYARKYALNGLLLLDDNKDPDSQDNTKKTAQTAPKKPESNLATDKQRKLISDKLFPIGYTTPDEIKNYLSTEYGINGLLTKADAETVISDLMSNESEDEL